MQNTSLFSRWRSRLLSRSLLILAGAIFSFLLPLAVAAQDQETTEEIEVSIPEPEIRAEKDHLEIKMRAVTYRIEDPKVGEGDRELYEALPSEEKVSFHNNRRLFLSMVARGLNLVKYGFGVGSIVKEKIRYQVKKMRAQEVISPDATSDKIKFRERSQLIVAGFLRGIDRNLWRQASLFSRSNEFGIVAAGGLETLGGKGNRGFGGIIDLGISLGYNRDEKALVIQIFKDFEKFKSTSLPVVFIAGIVGKMGTYVANQRPGQLFHEGISFYPPAIPGFSSVTKDNFMAGFSTGLTLPPSPFGDALTYTDTLEQQMLLRVMVMPISKGFLRIQTSVGVKTFRALVSTVKEAIHILHPDRVACNMVLTRESLIFLPPESP